MMYDSGKVDYGRQGSTPLQQLLAPIKAELEDQLREKKAREIHLFMAERWAEDERARQRRRLIAEVKRLLASDT